MSKKIKQSNAFTLAEVLITLGVLGVVAAMTLPTLIANHQKKQTVTQLKSGYTKLNQAVMLSYNENGELSNWNFPSDYTTKGIIEFSEKYILPYYKVVKRCDGYCPNYTATYLNGTKYVNTRCTQVLVADNNLLTFCTAQSSSGSNGNVYVSLDINGTTGPNKYGRDIFEIAMIKQYAQGYKIDVPGWQIQDREQLLSADNSANCNKSAKGQRCMALIIQDSWEIKDDYPW